MSAASPASPSAPDEPMSAVGDADLFCPACGYSLRGIDSERCPECGASTAGVREVGSRIPWVHRRQIGRFRAYRRTVWMTIARPTRLAAEAARPVSLADARRFWVVTAFLAAMPPMCVVVAAIVHTGGTAVFDVASKGMLQRLTGNGAAMNILTGGSSPRAIDAPPWVLWNVLLPISAGATRPGVPLLVIALFGLAATGVGTYWFHPRSIPVIRQNRATALGFYSAGPLGALPLFLTVGLAFWLWHWTNTGARVWLPVPRPVQIGATAIGFGGAALLVLLFWLNTLRLLSATTRCGTARILAAAILLPLTWLACSLLTLGVVPWVIGYVWLMTDSLRP